MPSLLSVNVGMPKDVDWQGKTVSTAVWKQAVQGPRMVRRLNIDGDAQGDTAGHGGEQRAVLVYQIESYRYWQQHFGRHDFIYGQFGENLTVDGLPDDEVCIGDRYRIGEVEFEVTQPRVTCYRVGLRLGEPELPALLVSHHRPGFYMRVLAEGHIEAGDPIIKTLSGPGNLTVADTDALLYLPDRDRAKLRLAVQIPALSPGWKGSFSELLETEDDSDSTAEPAWAGFRPLRVTDVVPETSTVSSIYLADPEGIPLPSARAGQYLTIRVESAGRPAAVRSYSLSSAPDAGVFRISVKLERNGLASTYLNRQLQPDATLEAAAPRGDFVLQRNSAPVLLISAGIGVTPVLSMLHHLAAQRSDREVWWIHGARGPSEHALATEAHALLAALPNAHEHVFYSAASPAERESAGAAPGRITGEVLSLLGLPVTATAYVCGPAPFMADVEHALTAIGLDAGHIRTELFGALASIRPGVIDAPTRAPHPPSGPPGAGPLITFARSGIAAPFAVETKSILEFAEACDISTRSSCRAGVCHTCTTPLISGSTVYKPSPLEPPTDGDVLICCARPETDIVLDM